MEQKEYWNNAADKKEFTTPFQEDEFSALLGKNSTILDVGCGYGRTLNELYHAGYGSLYGIDFSEKMIERGKNLNPNLDLRVQTTNGIDFPDNYFDGVILFAVLTCIVDNEEQLALMKEIRRVLKPGGIIYINDFLLNNDERNILRYKKFDEKYNQYGVFELPEGAIVRHHDINWVRECIRPFEIIKLNQITFTTMNGNKSNGYYFFGKNTK